MPTTTEVEARLRRTAAACEPLVEDLLGDPPTPVVVPLAGRRRRGPARGGLVAAALLLVVAVAGVALAVARDEPASDVATEGNGPSTVPPAEPGPVAEGLDVLLPDGTRLDVGLPDPDAWSLAGAQLVVEVDGGAEPVLVDLEQATLDEIGSRLGGEPQVEERGVGVHLVTGAQVTVLVVERGGWSAVVTVTSAGRPEADLAAETVARLAEQLDFTVTDRGPVDLTAPGLTVVDVSQMVETSATTDGETAQLVITRRDVPGAPACSEGLDPAAERCVDGFEVQAFGPTAVAALSEVTIEVLTDPSAPADAPSDDTATTTTAAPDLVAVDLALADGSTAYLGLPPTPAWRLEETHALVDLGSPDGGYVVRFTHETVEDWAAVRDLDLGLLPDGGGAWLGVQGPNEWLLVERGGWTAAIGVAGDGALDPDAVGQSDESLADDVVAALGREMSFAVTPAGPTDLTGPGLAVTGARATLRADPEGGDPGDLLLLEVGPVSPDACEGTPNLQNRCFEDDTVRMTGLGSGGRATLAAMTLELTT